LEAEPHHVGAPAISKFCRSLWLRLRNTDSKQINRTEKFKLTSGRGDTQCCGASALVPGKDFDAAPALTLLYIKTKFLKQTHVETILFI
jgi:hypothetical protein